MSSLPVNPTTPSEENKIVLKRRRRGQERKKINKTKEVYLYINNGTKKVKPKIKKI